MDLGCEKTWAFVNEYIEPNGDITYCLNPKFIIGSYNRNSKLVTMNPNFEVKLSSSTLKDLEKKLLEAIAKTEAKNKSLENQLLETFAADNSVDNNLNLNYSSEISDFGDDIDWDEEDTIKK